MNVKVAYIPKSKKAREIAKILKCRVKDCAGKYVGNVEPNLSPEQALKIAYTLFPEAAESDEREALYLAESAVNDPEAFCTTLEKAEQHYDLIARGGWALGIH